MATTSYGTPMVSSTMPNTTGMSTAPSTITITSPMVSPVMPVTPRVSSRAPLPMTQTQTPIMTSTPTVSTVMPNPVVPTQTITTPMTTTGTSGPLVNRNMGLPLSSARPIEVTETTSNLEQIQNFPVIGRAADGTHFHQDPVSGQVYRMTEEFHQRIPAILMNRIITVQNETIESINNGTKKIEPRLIEKPVISTELINDTNRLIIENESTNSIMSSDTKKSQNLSRLNNSITDALYSNLIRGSVPTVVTNSELNFNRPTLTGADFGYQSSNLQTIDLNYDGGELVLVNEMNYSVRPTTIPTTPSRIFSLTNQFINSNQFAQSFTNNIYLRFTPINKFINSGV